MKIKFALLFSAILVASVEVSAQQYSSCLEYITETTERWRGQMNEELEEALDIEGFCGCLPELASDADYERCAREHLSFGGMIDPTYEIWAMPANWNDPEALNVTGCGPYAAVPMYVGMAGYMIELGLSGTRKYVMIDSGAAEVFISEEWGEELKARGALSEKLKTDQIQLADGTIKLVHVHRVQSLEIGSCRINDIQIGIMEDLIIPVIGRSVLEQFDSWRVNKSKMQVSFTVK